MSNLESLTKQALANFDAVSDDPEGRYALCARFYERYGHACGIGAGFGDSELAFMRWEIRRGVLAPLDASRPGSPWWRSVNEALLCDAELAHLVYESTESMDVPQTVRRWLAYIRMPNEQTWYHAHNGSVVSGYLSHMDAARGELDGERIFMNIVLYRLLYAGALASGAGVLGPLHRVLANPVLPAVDILVDIQNFYPADYPLTRVDIRRMLGQGDSLLDLAVRIFDEGIILPEAAALYTYAAATLEIPELATLVRDGRPYYPV